MTQISNSTPYSNTNDSNGSHSNGSHSNNSHSSPVAPKKSKFTPTCKGILMGAVAGSVLPVFGTISGAIIGGIAGKVYEKKCSSPAA